MKVFEFVKINVFVYQCDASVYLFKNVLISVAAYAWFPTYTFLHVCAHHITALLLLD